VQGRAGKLAGARVTEEDKVAEIFDNVCRIAMVKTTVEWRVKQRSTNNLNKPDCMELFIATTCRPRVHGKAMEHIRKRISLG